MQQDLAQVAKWMQTRWHERVTLAGQSEGAGLAVLAAAAPDNGMFSAALSRWVFQTLLNSGGLSATTSPISLMLILMSRLFNTTDYLPKDSTITGSASIQSSIDDFITKEEADALFEAAEQPKTLQSWSRHRVTASAAILMDSFKR